MLRNLVKYSMHFLLRAWCWHTAIPFLQSHTLKLTKVMVVATNWFTTITCYICIVLYKFINTFIYLHKNVCEGCSILILQLMQLRTNRLRFTQDLSSIKWQCQHLTSHLMTSQCFVFSDIQPLPLIDQFRKCICICCYFISGIKQNKYAVDTFYR